jgi:phosphohistidine swiveling domain-containing protein
MYLPELAEYYEHFVAWWAPMAVAFTLGDLENVSSEVREGALRLRASEQEYSEKLAEVYWSFIARMYPELAALAWYLTPEEVFSGLKFTPAQTQEIEGQRFGFAFLNGELVPLDQLSQALGRHNIVLEEEASSDGVASTLHGTVAARGRARGKVRIVHSRADIGKVQEGEILVTEMTTPDFVPAMHRAGAIVTDEGGMTSHAAIVSRELGKPCVVGTRVATQRLRDGMEVEVDAEVGVVRILS